MTKNVLTYKDYIATVHYSQDDEVFFGRIEGIEDLVAFEGQSVPELKKAFHDAVEDYLEIAREVGKSPEKTHRGQPERAAQARTSQEGRQGRPFERQDA